MVIREIYDQGKVLLLGEDGQEHYTELAQEMVDRDTRLTEYNYFPRWGGNPNVTTFSATSMEPGGYLPTPAHRPIPRVTEWRCENCESVMLAEHRKCEDCGAPRHFLYGTGDD